MTFQDQIATAKAEARAQFEQRLKSGYRGFAEEHVRQTGRYPHPRLVEEWRRGRREQFEAGISEWETGQRTEHVRAEQEALAEWKAGLRAQYPSPKYSIEWTDEGATIYETTTRKMTAQEQIAALGEYKQELHLDYPEERYQIGFEKQTEEEGWKAVITVRPEIALAEWRAETIEKYPKDKYFIEWTGEGAKIFEKAAYVPLGIIKAQQYETQQYRQLVQEIKFAPPQSVERGFYKAQQLETTQLMEQMQKPAFEPQKVGTLPMTALELKRGDYKTFATEYIAPIVSSFYEAEFKREAMRFEMEQLKPVEEATRKEFEEQLTLGKQRISPEMAETWEVKFWEARERKLFDLAIAEWKTQQLQAFKEWWKPVGLAERLLHLGETEPLPQIWRTGVFTEPKLVFEPVRPLAGIAGMGAFPESLVYGLTKLASMKPSYRPPPGFEEGGPQYRLGYIISQTAFTLGTYYIAPSVVLSSFVGRTAVSAGVGVISGAAYSLGDPEAVLKGAALAVAISIGVEALPKLAPHVPVPKYGKVEIPLEEGGTITWRGIYISKGTKVPAMWGFWRGDTNVDDLILSHGVTGEAMGWVPVSNIEVAVTIQAMERLGYQPVIVQTAKDVMGLMTITQDVKSKFLQELLPMKTRTLSEKGVATVKEYVLSKSRLVEEVYGSFATRAQLAETFEYLLKTSDDQIIGGLRLPADIDIQLKIGAEKAFKFTQELAETLKKAGEVVRISPDTPTLIEAYVGGGRWAHAVDIHYLGEPIKDVLQPTLGKAWGFTLEKGTIKIESIPVMRLSEQGLRKGVSILGFTEEKTLMPVTHRMKDIPDFFQIQKTLLLSRTIRSAKGETILAQLTDVYQVGVTPLAILKQSFIVSPVTTAPSIAIPSTLIASAFAVSPPASMLKISAPSTSVMAPKLSYPSIVSQFKQVSKPIISAPSISKIAPSSFLVSPYKPRISKPSIVSVPSPSTIVSAPTYPYKPSVPPVSSPSISSPPSYPSKPSYPSYPPSYPSKPSIPSIPSVPTVPPQIPSWLFDKTRPGKRKPEKFADFFSRYKRFYPVATAKEVLKMVIE